ncbi:MAG TPA: DUF4351 domain-containing protein [Gelria sp.]|nr:DUF4351 domain-containing protein [Gelria sp.]
MKIQNPHDRFFKETFGKVEVAKDFLNNYLPEDIKKFTPNYEYLLYDLSRYTDDEIKGEAIDRIAMTIMRDIFTEDNKGLLELDDKQTGIEYFETLMRYIFSARADLTRADFNAVVKKIDTTHPEGSETVMTLAEIFKEEGREAGMKAGEAKALARTAIKLLTKKFGLLPEEFKTGILKLDSPTLDVMIDGILDYKSLEEVKRYLQ